MLRGSASSERNVLKSCGPAAAEPAEEDEKKSLAIRRRREDRGRNSPAVVAKQQAATGVEYPPRSFQGPRLPGHAKPHLQRPQFMMTA